MLQSATDNLSQYVRRVADALHLYTTLVLVGLTAVPAGMHKTSCSGESRLPCTYLAHHEPESVKMLFIIIIIHYTLMLAVL